MVQDWLAHLGHVMSFPEKGGVGGVGAVCPGPSLGRFIGHQSLSVCVCVYPPVLLALLKLFFLLNPVNHLSKPTVLSRSFSAPSLSLALSPIGT